MALALVGFYAWTGPWDPDVVWFERGASDAHRIGLGELWRCVTALSLHSDVAHVAATRSRARSSARCCFRRYGAGVGAVLLLGSGALGNWLAAEWHGFHYASVGRVDGAVRRDRRARGDRDGAPLAGAPPVRPGVAAARGRARTARDARHGQGQRPDRAPHRTRRRRRARRARGLARAAPARRRGAARLRRVRARGGGRGLGCSRCARPERSGLRLRGAALHGHDRHVRAADHALGGAAEHHVRETRAAAGPDHDQVGVGALGRLEDRGIGARGGEDRLDLDPRERGLQLGELLARPTRRAPSRRWPRRARRSRSRAKPGRTRAPARACRRCARPARAPRRARRRRRARSRSAPARSGSSRARVSRRARSAPARARCRATRSAMLPNTTCASPVWPRVPSATQIRAQLGRARADGARRLLGRERAARAEIARAQRAGERRRASAKPRCARRRPRPAPWRARSPPASGAGRTPR